MPELNDKRFSFFCQPIKKKAEGRHSIVTLPFSRNIANASQKSKSQIIPLHK
jgi:hypothetical protein